MIKMLVFDMDGTITDLYSVENWKNKLRMYDVSPYMEALPFYNPIDFSNLLNTLKNNGWKIAIVTWLAKNSTIAYDKKVRQAKKAWLTKYNIPYDYLHCVKYGTTKANCVRNKADYQILIDDNKKVRDGWKLGTTINAQYNIIPCLTALLN